MFQPLVWHKLDKGELEICCQDGGIVLVRNPLLSSCPLIYLKFTSRGEILSFRTNGYTHGGSVDSRAYIIALAQTKYLQLQAASE